MKAAAAALDDLFADSNQFVMWEVCTVTMADGTVVQWPVGEEQPTGNTVLLMHMFGANGSQDIVDSSGRGHVITAHGGARLTTDFSPFGTSSLQLPGQASAYLSIPNSPDFDFAARPFRIDAKVRRISVGVGGFGAPIISRWNSGLPVDDNADWSFYMSTAGQAGFAANNTSIIAPSANTAVPNDGLAHDVEVDRGIGPNANLFTLRIDGVTKATATWAGTIRNTANQQLTVGTGGAANIALCYIEGNLNDIQITVPPFPPPADYTPSLSPFPDPTTDIAPVVKRGRVRSVIGLEVDSLDLTLQMNSEVQVQGVPLAQFARLGGFDGGIVAIEKFFSASWTSAACGSLNIFRGRVADVDVTGTEVKMTVNSDLELLNIKMPRNIYMASCIHTLYGPGCGLSAAAFTVTGNVTANSTTGQVNCNLAQAAGFFDLGTIAFTTGDNAGQIRTIKTHTTGVIVPTYPFEFAPDAGDLFEAKPGCDKTYGTCGTKFANTANNRSFEFIPAPELTY